MEHLGLLQQELELEEPTDQGQEGPQTLAAFLVEPEVLGLEDQDQGGPQA